MGRGRDRSNVVLHGVDLLRNSSIHLSGGRNSDELSARLVDVLLMGHLDLLLAGGQQGDHIAGLVELADRSDGELVAIVDGGAGDDSLKLAVQSKQSNIERALLKGGLGFDVCKATRNVEVVGCER